MSYTESFLKAFRPRTKMTGSEWADKFRYIAPGTSPEPGEWRTSRVPYLREPLNAATDKHTETVVLCCSSQVGKALALDTPLPTPAGWVTMGELRVGDTLFDEKGEPCRVLAKTEIMRNHRCYAVTFSDGERIIADAGHRWYVECDYAPLMYDGRRGVWEGVIDTERMKEMHDAVRAKTGNRNNFAIPVAKPLHTKKADLLIQPYTLGVWLGDGHSYSNQFCGHTDDLAIVESVRKEGYIVEVSTKGNAPHLYEAKIDPPKDTGMCRHGHVLAVVGLTKAGYCAECGRQYANAWGHKKRGTEYAADPVIAPDGFITKLKRLGVFGKDNKRIPPEYLRASKAQRWALLRGLMDTDGACGTRGRCEITLKSKPLALDVAELVRSLGLKPSIREKIAKCNGKKFSVLRIDFVAYSDQPVFGLKRKQKRLKARKDGRSGEVARRRIVSVEPVPPEPVQCIAVDSPSHLFLAGRSMIPTHNSELLLNVMGFYCDQDPAPQLMLQPTLEAAESFSKERIDPTFRFSPGLADKLEEGQDGRGTSRKSSTTIRMKHYPGGYLALVGANSPSGLASRPIRVLLCDEIDRYTSTKEGDPLKLAIQRTTNFHNRKLVFVSTPTIKGVSQIDEWYMKSDQRQYYVPCPYCGAEHVLKWEDVKWDKDEAGNALPMSAHMVCPECGEITRGAYKPNMDMLQKGRWKAGNKDSRIRGYHLNSLYSPWVNLYALVEEFTAATRHRDKAGLQEFINLKLGEAWDELAGSEDIWEHLHRRREYYRSGNIPDGVLVLTAGVDVQRDRLECTIYGWGKDRECWGIEHRVFIGAPDMPDAWAQLDILLQAPRTLDNGAAIPISCVLVDSGDGAYSENVYRYTKARERSGVFSIKGRGGQNVPLVNQPTRGNSQGALLFSLGVDSGKSLVMGRLQIEDEGAGYVHYPRQAERGFNENFFQQLTAEVFEQKFERGKMTTGWKKIRERNEALDCFVYATAAIEILNPNFDALADYYKGGGGKAAVVAPKRKHGTMSKGISF